MKNNQLPWKTVFLVLCCLCINQTWSAYLSNSEEYNNENKLLDLQKQKYLKYSYNHEPEYGKNRYGGGNIIAGKDKMNQATSGSAKPEDYNYNDTYQEDNNTNKKTQSTAVLGNWRSLPHGSYDKNDDVVTGNAPTYGNRMIWPDQSSIFNTYKNSDAYGGFEGDSGSKRASDMYSDGHGKDEIELQDDKDANGDEDDEDIDDNDDDDDDDEGQKSADSTHTLSRKRRGFDEWFIAPHTRWCGRGNIANNTYNELGGAVDADRCCRRHDLCPLFIPAFTTRFQYFNFRPYTLSHCSCDRRFRTCLKMNNDEPSDTIGQFFFNLMPSQCFILRNEHKCADRDTDGTCLKESTRKRAHVRSNLKY